MMVAMMIMDTDDDNDVDDDDNDDDDDDDDDDDNDSDDDVDGWWWLCHSEDGFYAHYEPFVLVLMFFPKSDLLCSGDVWISSKNLSWVPSRGMLGFEYATTQYFGFYNWEFYNSTYIAYHHHHHTSSSLPSSSLPSSSLLSSSLSS